MARIKDPATLFQSISDPSRLRLLRLLFGEELNVQEMVRITGLSQPRVSKHLAILRDQGWLRQRREGTWSWYRAVLPEDFPAGESLFRQVLTVADDVEEAEGDDQVLSLVLADRQLKSQDFFAGIAHRWDDIRSEFEHPDLLIGALGSLVDPTLKVLDIGTGTGAMLPVFAGATRVVVALDNSQAMLVRAQARCRAQGRIDNPVSSSNGSLAAVDFCAGDVDQLPFADKTFDACNCSMALHHVPKPEAAMQEMARVVKSGGRVMVTAFCSHKMGWMREELAHQQLGFSREEIEGFFKEAGLRLVRYLVRGRQPGGEGITRNAGPGGKGLVWPEVFLATGIRMN
ncbi:MAG: metalloregulator ArsR/SmtB family transcription factor [Gemmatimonadales bacterium]|nr:metalloregulator ArsR/SmtB family transcription factor [Gemmatimonadales bacterium]